MGAPSSKGARSRKADSKGRLSRIQRGPANCLDGGANIHPTLTFFHLHVNEDAGKRAFTSPVLDSALIAACGMFRDPSLRPSLPKARLQLDMEYCFLHIPAFSFGTRYRDEQHNL